MPPREAAVFSSADVGRAVAIDDDGRVFVDGREREVSWEKQQRPAPRTGIVHSVDESGAKGVVVSDNDDDGESGSGAKLAALLELTGASNVLVVVSRWFGGIHLGPARFKYIASVGRQALEEAGLVSSANPNVSGGGGGGGGKKR